MLQAKGAEIVLGNVAREEGVGLFAERFDFLANGPIMLIFQCFTLKEGRIQGSRHSNHL